MNIKTGLSAVFIQTYLQHASVTAVALWYVCVRALVYWDFLGHDTAFWDLLCFVTIVTKL